MSKHRNANNQQNRLKAKIYQKINNGSFHIHQGNNLWITYYNSKYKHNKFYKTNVTRYKLWTN